jgi:toxin ParE1/3/4
VKKRKILYRRAAQTDLAEAFDWYHSIDPGLAERFLADLRLSADRIAGHPLSCPIFLGTTRRFHLKIFPYFVYYRLERGAIVVHAVLHVRRNTALHRKRSR